MLQNVTVFRIFIITCTLWHFVDKALFACMRLIGVFPNVFTEYSDKKYLLVKELEPTTSCVRDQDTTTVQARDM